MIWIEGTVLSGLIGKLISDGIEASREKINKAVENKISAHQSLESQIYNLIVDALNRISGDRYKDNQSRIYTAAEIMLQDLKDGTIHDADAVKNGLTCICYEVNKAKCETFAAILDHEISKDCYSELRREIMLVAHRRESEKTSRIEKKIDAADQKMETGFDELKKAINDFDHYHEKRSDVPFLNNKKDDYIRIWNSRLFLHQNKDSRPMTLSEAFIMPYHTVHCNTFVQSNLYSSDTPIEDFIEEGCLDGRSFEQPKEKFQLTGIPFDEAIDRFREIDGCVTMLLTGVPGIGKTTITACLANKFREDDNLIILRFRDWDREELQTGLFRAICNTLICKPSDLNGKMLILDGFDEMKCLDIREKILAAFFNDIFDLRDFKCMITSRPAYIDAGSFSYIFELRAFDLYRIRAFYRKITDRELNVQKIDPDNLDVLGVPVILYMAIMSNMDLTEHTTRPGLYNRIFAEKGGIFDRFYYGGFAYDQGAHPFRNSRNINIYLEFLCEIAYKMFKSNSLMLSRENCKVPELDFQGKTVGILEFPIKHLFESNEYQIEFIHKSIYEYFTAEYMLKEIFHCIQKGKVEALAGALGELLKDSILSDEIAEYLSYQIRQHKMSALPCKKTMYRIPSFSVSAGYLNDAFSIMLKNGMTYFCKENPDHLIVRETNVFSNMLRLLQHCLDSEHRLRVKHVKEFASYLALQNIWADNRYLAHIDLSETRFENVLLRNLIFKDANLEHAVFQSVDLTGSRFEDVDLTESSFLHSKMNQCRFEHVNLGKAVIQNCEFANGKIVNATIETKMTDTNLTGIKFQGNFIKCLDFTKSNLRHASFEENYIADYIAVTFRDAIMDGKLILSAEKTFGKRVRFCKVDLCDSVFTYQDYCHFREQKLSALQGEILDMIEEGRNYAEMKE